MLRVSKHLRSPHRVMSLGVLVLVGVAVILIVCMSFWSVSMVRRSNMLNDNARKRSQEQDK
jgi:hypothetical protein